MMMYFRMLKKELKEKKGLNIILFLFMIMANLFMTIGFIMLYTNTFSAQKTYELTNTSDFFFFIDQSVEDIEKNRNFSEEMLGRMEGMRDYTREESVLFQEDSVEFIYREGRSEPNLEHCPYYWMIKMPKQFDIPIDMDDRTFRIAPGEMAVSQNLAFRRNLKEGDSVRITTQMGNIYELKITTVYKSPVTSFTPFLLLSDADMDMIFRESPVRSDLYRGSVDIGDGDYFQTIMKLGTDIMYEGKDAHLDANGSKALATSNEGIKSLLISIVLEVIAFFLIMMLFITIRFTMKSVIKQEEREIGMMKAIGVYSFSYRAFFAVKYIAISIAGAFVGIPLALVLSKPMINSFVYNIVLPSQTTQILLALLAMITCITLIGLCCVVSLRYMNRIKVMDAIHGENRGERFSRLPGLTITKRKKMGIPLFLAVSDILRQIRRYLLLIGAYMCAVFIVLLVIRIGDTIISRQYMKAYWLHGDQNVVINLSDDFSAKLGSRSGGGYPEICKELDKEMNEQGIPLETHCKNLQTVNVSFGEGEHETDLIVFGDYDNNEWILNEGGKVPELANEVSYPNLHAQNNGLHIGDVISIEYCRYTEDYTTVETVTDDFVITAFHEQLGSHIPQIIMGNEFERAIYDSSDLFSRVINCPEDEYDAMFEKMRSLYSEDELTLIHDKDLEDYYLGDYATLFHLLLTITCVIISLVLVLLTFLYERIFVEEECADIALLKSVGFTGGQIRSWHYLRMILLTLIAIAPAFLLTQTLGNFILENAARILVKVGSFPITTEFLSNFVVAPIGLLAVVSVATLFSLKWISDIKIWRVKNE